jgi:hypothetical protein
LKQDLGPVPQARLLCACLIATHAANYLQVKYDIFEIILEILREIQRSEQIPR